MVYRRQDRDGWWFRLDNPKAPGKRIQRYGGSTKAAAKTAQRALEQKLKLDATPLPADDFETFIETHYWPGQQNHLTPRGRQRESGILNKHLAPYFAGSMRNITRIELLSYIHKRLNETPSNPEEKQDRRRRLRPVTGETCRKELIILKHILRLAVKLQLLKRNPFDDLEPLEWPTHGPERTRHLVGDEWQRLLAATPLAMRPAVVLLVNTGMRRGEMMNLEWSDLNLETGTAWIAKTKGSLRTGKGRFVRLPAEMIELIKMLPPLASSQKLFWQFKATQLSTEIGRAIRRAQLHNLRLHDLRHTFATTIRQSGHGLDTIAKLLGHADLRQTKRYAHLAEEQMTQALQSLAGRFNSNPTPKREEEDTNEFSTD